MLKTIYINGSRLAEALESLRLMNQTVELITPSRFAQLSGPITTIIVMEYLVVVHDL
jgi:hypothetical protein